MFAATQFCLRSRRRGRRGRRRLMRISVGGSVAAVSDIRHNASSLSTPVRDRHRLPLTSGRVSGIRVARQIVPALTSSRVSRNWPVRLVYPSAPNSSPPNDSIDSYRSVVSKIRTPTAPRRRVRTGDTVRAVPVRLPVSIPNLARPNRGCNDRPRPVRRSSPRPIDRKTTYSEIPDRPGCTGRNSSGTGPRARPRPVVSSCDAGRTGTIIGTIVP